MSLFLQYVQRPPAERPSLRTNRLASLFQTPQRGPATAPAPPDAITINYEFPLLPSRPTLVQLADAITFLPFHADTIQETVDPISHVEFEEGQTICQLNNCRHVFQIRSLMQWLEVSQTCPVCRGPVITPNTEAPIEPPRQDLEQFFRSLTQPFVASPRADIFPDAQPPNIL